MILTNGIGHAAFQLTQLAFAALVKKGILTKAEAEQILRQAIEAIKTSDTGDRAAELLAWPRGKGTACRSTNAICAGCVTNGVEDVKKATIGSWDADWGIYHL